MANSRLIAILFGLSTLTGWIYGQNSDLSVPESRTSYFYSNPGTCPSVQPNTFATCARLCAGDYACRSRNQKCCYNGCGYTCQTATSGVVKAGTCPAAFDYGTCSQLCSRDSQCSGSQKCCSNGCGTQCMNPRTVLGSSGSKPGVCPALQSGYQYGCRNQCTNDNQCTGSGKCCRNACARVCAVPMRI